MLKLYVGRDKVIEPPKGGFCWIGDEIPDVGRARVFDIDTDCVNPLQAIHATRDPKEAYRKARQFAGIFYAASPEGSDTLTLRNGRRTLARLFLKSKMDRLDKVQGYLWKKYEADELTPAEGEALGAVEDVLLSPVLKRILCNPTNFSLNPRSKILVRLNRTELSDFDARFLGLLFMAEFSGQLVLPNLGFYVRDFHIMLIEQKRLIAGVNSLKELEHKAPELREAVMLMDEKIPCRTTGKDAMELADDRGLVKGTNAYEEYVKECVNGRTVER